MRQERPLSPAVEECVYHHGIALFNAHRFFEAHEVWEAVWRPLPYPADVHKRFYQGLIQMAVALEHFRRGNTLGPRRLHARFTYHLSFVPACYLGLDVAALRTQMTDLLAPLLGPTPLPQGTLCLNPHAAPHLALTPRPSPLSTQYTVPTVADKHADLLP
jgi:hypothetical protein